jgi:hypothetical protein
VQPAHRRISKKPLLAIEIGDLPDLAGLIASIMRRAAVGQDRVRAPAGIGNREKLTVFVVSKAPFAADPVDPPIDIAALVILELLERAVGILDAG